MGALYARVELDPGTGRRQTHTKVDVLHHRDGLVEASNRLERILPDRSEAGPERRCGTWGLMVYVMMQQVSEGRNDALCRRLVIV